MNDPYVKLRAEYAQVQGHLDTLHKQREEYLRLWVQSRTEVIANPHFEDVSSLYQFPMTQIEEGIKVGESLLAELEKRLPCDEFIDRFGLELHEVYRHRYPINMKTQVDQVYTMHPEYIIERPELGQFSIFIPDMPPPIFKTQQITIRFEQWHIAHPDGASWWLAYAPELNTVVVRMEP